jgi:hypothetical protein
MINVMGLKPGETVLDPMMRSGTVLIEARRMGIIPIADCGLRIEKVTGVNRFSVNEDPVSMSKWYYSGSQLNWLQRFSGAVLYRLRIADCRLRIEKVTSAKRFSVNKSPLSTPKSYYIHVRAAVSR